MKHTPGPWYFNKSVDLEKWLPCITRSPLEGQANPAYYGEGIICAFDEGFAPSEQDAELIARSPEMAAELESLKATQRELVEALSKIANLDAHEDSDEGFNEWGEADCFHQARDCARAALQRVKE